MSLKEAKRCCKYALLTNICDSDSAITPVISGVFGVGKSALFKELAHELGGFCLVVEGGSLKEGEFPGLPYSFTKMDNGVEDREIRFTPYYVTAAVQRLEKYVHEQAKKGFNTNSVKLEEDGHITYKDSKGHVETIAPKTKEEEVLLGTVNHDSFGEELPAEIKLKLIKSGEIKPVIIFIDEMNRTDGQTMKEFMNIILTRAVNGYKFPWWCFFASAINPCSQDSVYATNDLDAAQLDRFLKIKVVADVKEWTEWAMNNNINRDYVMAVNAISKDMFSASGRGYDDTDTTSILPSARSHTVCSYLYNSKQLLAESGLLNEEDIQDLDRTVEDLIMCKLGSRAGADLLNRLKNKESFIDPAAVLTGKKTEIDEKLVEKITSLRPLSKSYLVLDISRYLAAKGVKPFYDALTIKDNPEKAAAAKLTWSNTLAQLKQLMTLIDASTQQLFAQYARDQKLEIGKEDKKYDTKEYKSQTILKPIIHIFSNDIVTRLRMLHDIKSSGDLDK